MMLAFHPDDLALDGDVAILPFFCLDTPVPLRAHGMIDTIQSTKGMIIMHDGNTLSLPDIAYLGKVLDAVKSDNPPALTTICPECDETPEPGDGAHILLNTSIPGYWAERGLWGYPNPYEMNREDTPFVLIGCAGYHIVQF